MRRRLWLPLLSWHRAASSFGSLLKAQSALQKGKAPTALAAADYVEFFDVPISLDTGIGQSALDYFNNVGKQISEQGDSRAVQEQTSEERGRADLAIFLAGFNYRTKTFCLYSISEDGIVAQWGATEAGDSWGLADELMRFTRGVPQLLVLPVAESEKERRVLAPQVAELSRAITSSGLLPVTHVDTLELATSFDANPPPLKDVLVHSTSGTSLEPLSPQWFRAHWIYLRTLACKAVDSDPISSVNTYVYPRFDVFVIHLVRAGTRSMNVAIWDPVRRRRFAAKGMLSDILACLLDTPAQRLILMPTNRTDRATLFRCRTALLKAGRQCVVVFASEVREKYRRVYHSDPYRYWASVRETAGVLEADLLGQVYVTAGNTLRTYARKMLLESGTLEVEEARTTHGASADAEGGGLATMSDVEAWADVFRNPKRLAAEKAELRRYRRYLVVAYTATEHTAYGRPNNPVAAQNYVVSACLMDHSGGVLEPWAKYLKRGEFQLPSLADFDVLVAHNAKHLLLLLWNDAELAVFLRRGGRVWCTMLAEYLLDAQRRQTGSNTIHDVALKYGFMLPASSSLGTGPEELPLAFHRRFLLQAAPACAAMFTAQLELGRHQWQAVSLSHRMDSLLAMTSMEATGIFIDVAEADRQAKDLKSTAVTLDTVLHGLVPAEVPVDMREYFDWGSLPQLHAFFFGGSITIGTCSKARDSPLWTSNLVHLCHRYGPLNQMVGELHLQRYAAQCFIPASSAKLPQRIAQFITQNDSQRGKTYRLVLFDIETTGLNVATDEIIEIAMYDPVEGTTFTTLVNPQRRITPRTISIHHITDEVVQNAPTLDTVMRGVVEYLRLSKELRRPDEIVLLLGHNVFGIDEPMLRRALDTHSPDTDHDGILFCDSVVLLKALRAELNSQRTPNSGKTGRAAVLSALSSSLRLADLIEQLHITPEGELHRADTDTKALWFVLLSAFGLVGKEREEQRNAILTEAARSLLVYPAIGCFVPTQRKRSTVQVRLPGVAHSLIDNTKVVSSLQGKPFGDTVLEALHSRGVDAATVLLKRQRLDGHAARFLQSSGGGHFSALHPGDTVHQFIDMTATTTSRTTSMYPSCQNIPKDDKSSVRRLFTSRYGSQGRCIEVDYSQLEIVVLAILCGDENLAKDLNAGIDFHVKRAEFFSGLPYKEIYEGYKRGVPKYVKLRRTAKQFSFQRLYGAGVPLLHKTTGIPVEDLEASIALENEAYPQIAHFHRVVRSVALRPNNPGLPTGFIVELPTGARICFRTRDVVLNLPPLKNYPIQGYGAEIAQMMVGRLFRHFLKKDFYQQRAHLVNFVHDSVWIDCHVDVLRDCVRDTCRILSDVHRYVPQHFPGVEISVPLIVSAACGMDMCSMHSVGADGSEAQVPPRTQRRGNRSKSHQSAKAEDTEKEVQ